MGLEIKTVENAKDLKLFIKCQSKFYRNDPCFVPPIFSERKKLLDTEKNPFFQHSQMRLFLAIRNGEPVGRIAALTNENHNKTHNDRTGFFGFFECENEQETANRLFEAAEIWLASMNKNKIIGPENPSMNDEIGLLIDGFETPPMLLMTHNPRYYIELIENAGYRKAKDLYAYGLTPEFATEKLKRLKDIVQQRHNFKIRSVRLKDKKGLIEDIKILKHIYNEAWVPNWGFVKWTDAEFEVLSKDLKLIAREEFSLIAEHNGKPVAMAIALPNINECLIHNKSGSTLGAYWHLLTKRNKIKSFRIIALGVLPEYQLTGVDSVLYYEIGKNGLLHGIKFGEASWVLEDNVMMNRSLKQTLNAEVYKTYRLYEKDIEFY
jgi:GNAT superfamily N-acetyltransferase